MYEQLATKQDLQMLETRLKQDLTIRLAGMLTGAFGLMAGFLKLLS